MTFRKRIAGFCCFVMMLFVSCAIQDNAKMLVILHTNDLHDHIRADYDGNGGFAYVASYIKQEKKKNDHTIVLDAGDVISKGDMVAFASKSAVLFEAMQHVGYDVLVPGNHDDDYGNENYMKCLSLLDSTEIVCNNWFKEDGSLRFPASTILTYDDLCIAVIGFSQPQSVHPYSMRHTIEDIKREVEKTDSMADYTIVLCHAGTEHCMKIAPEIPTVDLFVTGHTHEIVTSPIQVKQTGALIVQAGYYADYVGRLVVKFNPYTGEVDSTAYQLVSMDHDSIQPDSTIIQMCKRKEQLLVPTASDTVIRCSSVPSRQDLAWLGAQALRLSAETDIGFCHSGEIIRALLPKGIVDVNAVFRTGGQRAYKNISLTMTGAQIEAYLSTLDKSEIEQTQWAGFRADRMKAGGYRTDLIGSKAYSVIMPYKEYDNVVRELTEEDSVFKELMSIEEIDIQTNDAHFTNAVVSLVHNDKYEAYTLDAIISDIKNKWTDE